MDFDRAISARIEWKANLPRNTQRGSGRSTRKNNLVPWAEIWVYKVGHLGERLDAIQLSAESAEYPTEAPTRGPSKRLAKAAI